MNESLQYHVVSEGGFEGEIRISDNRLTSLQYKAWFPFFQGIITMLKMS